MRRAGLTLQQIGERYGMSRQAVDDRFRRMKIKPQPLESVQKMNKEKLEHFYFEEKLPLVQIAAEFEVDVSIIRKALKRYKIPKRQHLKRPGKHQEFLDNMEIGGKAVIEVIKGNPYITMHIAAKRRGRKVSVRKISATEFEITRLK